MRERLRAQRRSTRTVAVIAMLAIVALVSLSLGVAGERKTIAQKVRDAKTPADHQAIAAFFEKKAQVARQEAKQDSQLKDAYGAKPDMQIMVSPCDTLVKHYQDIAKDLADVAEMHKKMAGMAR
jgi:hypothetical protein